MSRRPFRYAPALALAFLLAPSMSWAQTRVCTYETSSWYGDVGAIDTALSTTDLKEARILIEVMDREWECLARPVSPSQIAHYAQLRAYLAFHSQDSDAAIMWTRAAQFADSTRSWPAWVPEFHPLREILDMEEPTEIVTAEGQYLAIPKKGGVWVDGRFTAVPTAPVDVPVLVQVYDKDGARMTIYWQDTAPFKPELLTTDATVATAKPPKWYVPSPDAAAAVALAAATPAETGEPAVAATAEPEPVDLPPAPKPTPVPVAGAAAISAAALVATTAPVPAPLPAPVAAPSPAPVPAPTPAPTTTAPKPTPVPVSTPPDDNDGSADAAVAAAAGTAAAGAVVGAAVATGPVAASAACPAASTPDILLSTAETGWTAWTINDQGKLDKAWTATKAAAGCLSAVVNGKQAASVHRLYAVRAMGAGSDDTAVKALAIAARLDPRWTVPDGLGDEGARLSALYAKAKAAGVGTTVPLHTPDASKLYVDGLQTGERGVGAPALVQVTREGIVTYTTWLGGDDPVPTELAAP